MRTMMFERIGNLMARSYVKEENLITEVKVPRIKRENLHIEGGEKGFCVKAEEDKRHLESCFYIGHRVDPATTRVEFNRGLLTLRIPLSKEEIHGWAIPIAS